jgi:hypothetical protein
LLERNALDSVLNEKQFKTATGFAANIPLMRQLRNAAPLSSARKRCSVNDIGNAEMDEGTLRVRQVAA